MSPVIPRRHSFAPLLYYPSLPDYTTPLKIGAKARHNERCSLRPMAAARGRGAAVSVPRPLFVPYVPCRVQLCCLRCAASKVQSPNCLTRRFCECAVGSLTICPLSLPPPPHMLASQLGFRASPPLCWRPHKRIELCFASGPGGRPGSTYALSNPLLWADNRTLCGSLYSLPKPSNLPPKQYPTKQV